MANNYIPGFTPSLHGQPVKRMALGGRLESGRWFNEGRDRDTGDMPYTAEVASAAPAVAQSIASSPVAALTAAAPTAAAPTVAAYQQPTPEPAQANYGFDPYDLSGFDMYGLGEYASQFYQQPTPQTAATNYQSLPTQQPVQTAPYVDYATPTKYQSLPTQQPVQSAAYDAPSLSSSIGGIPGTVGSDFSGVLNKVLAQAEQQGLTQPTSYQRQPTPQPVQTAAYEDAAPLDLGNWSPSSVSGLQNLFTVPTTPSLLDKYIAEQAAKGIEVVSLNPYQGSGLDAINANIWNAFNQFDPNNPGATTGIVYRLDTGNDIGVPDGNGGWTYRNAGQVTWSPGTEYTMYDATGGKQGAVIATARTPEEMAKLVELSDKVPYYSLAKTADPNESINYGGMMPGKQDTRPGGVMGAFVNYGLPVALSFVPGLNWVGSAALAGAGSTAGKLMTGNSIEDALKSGLITAGTAGLLKAPILNNGGSLGGAIGGALEKVPGVGDALKGASRLVKGGTSYIDPTGGIVTEATKSVAPQLISGALTSGLQGALNTAAKYPGTVNYGDQVYDREPTLEEQFDDTFNAPTTVYGDRISDLAPAVTGAAGSVVSGYDPVTNEITAVADKTKPELDEPASGAAQAIANEFVDPNEIVVSNKYVPPSLDDLATGAIGALAPSLLQPGPQAPTTPPKKDGLGIDDILKLLPLLGGAAAAGGGGGGGGALSNFAGARGPLNPIFSAQLPAPNMQAAIARPMSGIDWYRYGYGPEQSFFTNVPQGAANTSTAYTGYEGGLAALIEKMRKAGLLPGYAAGGYAVGGPGDGREDKIPAMLSDGEYVIDAETVAMLGNGSSKAGADALDKFRVNIRKHKGRKLSKGEFSVDAKKPEQYLKGHK